MKSMKVLSIYFYSLCKKEKNPSNKYFRSTYSNFLFSIIAEVMIFMDILINVFFILETFRLMAEILSLAVM